ncbi:MAG: phosphohydrolase, partial [Lentisphaeria bacterium]|nr:phosphohydrolase [Lentisphaeria bacterium]
HAQVGSDLAREILTRFGYVDEMLIDQVTHCILCHRTRNGHVPQTLEAKIVFDADKLDSIGAIGIGRAFHFAGRFGAKVHNDKLAAIGSEAYSEEDTAYREYLVKLKHISKNLYTNSGKTLAKDRHDFMVRFFDQLNTETSS